VGELQAWVHNAVPRQSGATLRRKWERHTGLPWPKMPDGRNYDACHIKALADDGDNDPTNIKPMTREDHINHHKKNGDFKRWGGRRK
jgi:hypothetical protein